jgi:hypothetical protein
MNTRGFHGNVWTLTLAIALAAVLFSHSATAQTTVPLNTGYNHSVFSVYPASPQNPSPPSYLDNYWINIASAPNTPAGPAHLLHPANIAPWAPAFANSNWISAWSNVISQTGTAPDNPAYTIFRKCFCLLPNFKHARLSFSVRADDSVQVWLNSQMHQVLPPSDGNWNSAPFPGSIDHHFDVGRNCLYVLVEDIHGHMGFDLVGSVTADGLLPMPAAGAAGTFEPCECDRVQPGPPGSKSAKSFVEDDQQVIQAIVKIAEARRTAKQRAPSQGEAPKPEGKPGPMDPVKKPVQ